MALSRNEELGQELRAKKGELERQVSIAQRTKSAANIKAGNDRETARAENKAAFDVIADPLLASIAGINKQLSGETALE